MFKGQSRLLESKQFNNVQTLVLRRVHIPDLRSPNVQVWLQKRPELQIRANCCIAHTIADSLRHVLQPGLPGTDSSIDIRPSVSLHCTALQRQAQRLTCAHYQVHPVSLCKTSSICPKLREGHNLPTQSSSYSCFATTDDMIMFLPLHCTACGHLGLAQPLGIVLLAESLTTTHQEHPSRPHRLVEQGRCCTDGWSHRSWMQRALPDFAAWDLE